MSFGGKAKRVRIYVNEGDLAGHKPTHLAILELLRKENAAGATMFRGAEGFGGTGEFHSDRFVDIVMPRLPLVIEWVDSVERVERLIGQIEAMVVRGLITVDDTHVLLYAPHPVRRVSSHVTVGEVMTREVASVGPETPAGDVVELMIGKVYRAVPVVENGAPVGIITNSDLLVRGGLRVRMELLSSLDEADVRAELQRLSESGKTAKDIMSSPPVTAHAGTPLPEVADLMVHRRLKRLPVVDESGTLVGMVSRLDLLRTVAEGFSGTDEEPRSVGLNVELPIAEVMRREVPTVHPETPIGEVMQAVISTRLNRAVVVDAERRVVGVVTDAELLERVTPSLRTGALHSLMNRLPFVHRPPAEASLEHHATARVARDLMSTDVPVARHTTPVRDAIGPMLRGKEKLVAVVNDDLRLVGVVDRADLLRGLIERVR